jgi:hypothetical protein
MKKSDLNGKTVNELRDIAKNMNVAIDNNKSQSETLALLLADEKFVASLEKDGVGVFKIGAREITALSHITTVASIKAQVGYHLKFFPEVKATDLKITTPSGRVFGASELMNPQKFVKMQFASIYTDFSGNPHVEAVKQKLDLIVSKAYKQPLNWELVGSVKPADIMTMFRQTALALEKSGEISAEDVKLLSL